MKTLFKIENGFNIPDGTLLYPFLTAKDSGFNLLDGFSIAAGEILPMTRSKIHVHPFVTQVCFLLSGSVDVIMKDASSDVPYRITLINQNAVLTESGTFFQLDNKSTETARVLYIVCPAYLFHMENNRIKYDDALVLDESWEELTKMNWEIPKILLNSYSLEKRKLAFDSIEKLKQKKT
jgi:hypothetical protein